MQRCRTGFGMCRPALVERFKASRKRDAYLGGCSSPACGAIPLPTSDRGRPAGPCFDQMMDGPPTILEERVVRASVTGIVMRMIASVCGRAEAYRELVGLTLFVADELQPVCMSRPPSSYHLSWLGWWQEGQQVGAGRILLSYLSARDRSAPPAGSMPVPEWRGFLKPSLLVVSARESRPIIRAQETRSG